MPFTEQPKHKSQLPSTDEFQVRLQSRRKAAVLPITSRQRLGFGVKRLTSSNIPEMPIQRATVFSTAAHVFGPFLIAGIFALLIWIISLLLNINLWDWFKPKEPMPDIEFTIVQNTNAKKPERTRFFAEFNQQAGGRQDPTKAPEALNKPASATPPQKPTPAEKPTPQTQPQPQPKPAQPQQQSPQTPPPKPPVKQPPKPELKPPSFKPTIPMPSANKPTPPMPKMPTLLNGPISEKNPLMASTAVPSPMSLPTNGALAQKGAAGTTGANRGNPEDGPGVIPGISAQETDFGPYMSELKRRLTRNWHPPRRDASKRVVLKFEIGRDGNLLAVEIYKGSGEPLADEAAINAVKVSAPFRPLPADYQGQSVPVLFTFDYTVYGSSN